MINAWRASTSAQTSDAPEAALSLNYNNRPVG